MGKNNTVNKKANEIRELSVEETLKKIDSLEEEHFNLRFQARMGQLTNPLQLRYVKRGIARAKTILNEKKAAGKGVTGETNV